MTNTNLLGVAQGQYNDLVLKYINGDPSAVTLLDTVIGAGLDLCYIRSNSDDRVGEYLDYNDTRAEIDEAIDSIETDMDKLGLRAPIQDELDERDLDNGYFE